VIYAALTASIALAIVLGFAGGIASWTAGAWVALPLVALSALWISGAAATAMLGITSPVARPVRVPDGWVPTVPTAVLVTLCGEEPVPLASYMAALRAGLNHAGLGDAARIFVLSDTSGAAKIRAEEAAFAPLQADGTLSYRRRASNTGRKPGNIAAWLTAHGDSFTHMVVLDADSRMTATRIRRMIWQIEARPGLGLLQAGIALVPAATRFGHQQRVAARLLSRNFGRGFAAWTGDSGNYWGHNAIIRIAAFRAAEQLPRLSGPAPFGGDLLSHDFIEAAWIRRAGWSVALDPEPAGSAENAPQTLAEFHRRDRRWCQGNLQHLRLLGAPGLSAISRVHLASGILSYLVAPVWLLLVAMFALGAVPMGGALPLFLVALVLVLPKLCALVDWMGRAQTPWRRKVVLRAWAAELVLSSLIAPLVMLRQAAAVASVCMGRDCGWKSGRMPRFDLPPGLPEAGLGACLVTLIWLAHGAAAVWLAPVVLPLLAAPVIVRALDGAV
jgi:membrane glycosyltransferase